MDKIGIGPGCVAYKKRDILSSLLAHNDDDDLQQRYILVYKGVLRILFHFSFQG